MMIIYSYSYSEAIARLFLSVVFKLIFLCFFFLHTGGGEPISLTTECVKVFNFLRQQDLPHPLLPIRFDSHIDKEAKEYVLQFERANCPDDFELEDVEETYDVAGMESTAKGPMELCIELGKNMYDEIELFEVYRSPDYEVPIFERLMAEGSARIGCAASTSCPGLQATICLFDPVLDKSYTARSLSAERWEEINRRHKTWNGKPPFHFLTPTHFTTTPLPHVFTESEKAKKDDEGNGDGHDDDDDRKSAAFNKHEKPFSGEPNDYTTKVSKGNEIKRIKLSWWSLAILLRIIFVQI